MDVARDFGKKLNTILNSPEEISKTFDLVYVTDDRPGIIRKKKGKNFVYLFKDKPLRNQEELKRIKKLVIPPAWKKVWICSIPNGHLQATGFDLKQRKQYKYHSLWSELSSRTKFHRLADFGKHLPKIREQLHKDLSLKGLPCRKVLAAIVNLMEQTSIRIGNSSYEKLYGSYGLTTLKDKHVKFKGPEMKFGFKGKKGIEQNVVISDRKLARIVRQCRDIPGQDLFQYYDESGNHKHIDSGMVNNYIQEICGKSFSAKDFRTWMGTVKALQELKGSDYRNVTEMKKKIIQTLDKVSAFLGNTRTVCKKYYVHPAIISLFEKKELKKFRESKKKLKGLTTEEDLLLRILKKQPLLIPAA